jgi:hypothetical protein
MITLGKRAGGVEAREPSGEIEILLRMTRSTMNRMQRLDHLQTRDHQREDKD